MACRLGSSDVPGWFFDRWQFCGIRFTPQAGLLLPNSGQTVFRGQRPAWTFLAVLAGRMRLAQLEEELILETGESALIPPGYAFEERELSNQPGTQAGQALFSIIHSPATPHPLPALGLPAKVRTPDLALCRRRWEELLAGVRDFKFKSHAHFLAARGPFDSLLAEYFIQGFRQGAFQEAPEAEAPDWLRAVRNYIGRLAPRASLRFGDVVRKAGVSRSHLSHQYKRYYGETAFAFLRRVRIRLATRLLENNEALTVREVAWRSGYSDITLFHRHFRALLKMTPMQWRQGQKPKTAP